VFKNGRPVAIRTSKLKIRAVCSRRHGLTNSDQTAIERARTECKIDIVIYNRPDHFRRFIEWRGKIRIEKQSDRFLRCRQSFSNGRTLPRF
jgi:hypothetical protein